jgi:heme-degrading monooxygenase HmoA
MDFAQLPYSPAKLAAALTSIPLVKERIKAIEEFAYAEATAGRDIPGFKLVDKRATRRWKSEADVIEWAEKQGSEPYAKREILSPAQLEKEIAKTAPKGKKKEAGAAIEPFTEKISSGTALVPVTDERPSAKRITVEDFNVVSTS